MTVPDTEAEELDEPRLWVPVVADCGDTAASEDGDELAGTELAVAPEAFETALGEDDGSGATARPEGAAVSPEVSVAGSGLAIAGEELSVLSGGGLEIWSLVSGADALGSGAGEVEESAGGGVLESAEPLASAGTTALEAIEVAGSAAAGAVLGVSAGGLVAGAAAGVTDAGVAAEELAAGVAVTSSAWRVWDGPSWVSTRVSPGRAPGDEAGGAGVTATVGGFWVPDTVTGFGVTGAWATGAGACVSVTVEVAGLWLTGVWVTEPADVWVAPGL